MLSILKWLIFGSPLPTSRASHERLIKFLALPVFASDALSSVAYATEEILLVLVLAGTAALQYSMWISAGIVALLTIVAISYQQTIHAYPSGGGSYIVAKDNLGNTAGLTAGASLMIDYTLTVAVSIAAGVAALISWHPAWAPHREAICLGFILMITLANLRGVRESGALFAVPTYAFLLSMGALIFVGAYKLRTTGLFVPSSREVVAATQSMTILLILRAFAGGCTAMTGVEAVSNGIPAFRPPESKNAAATLRYMAAILGFIFIGIAYIAKSTGVIPSDHETVISQLAHAVFGTSWIYIFIQLATAGILVLAANTSYADFPRLASIMARDRFLPRQLYNVGDRLVFSNGIVLLALLASLLIVVFRGDTHALIPLYAVGVFLSFTLSQAGMVKHSHRLKERGWRVSAAISGTGAVVTGIVTLVIAYTKFWSGEPWPIPVPFMHYVIPARAGAWVVVLLIPCLATIFSKIHRHYIELGNELRLTDEDVIEPVENTVIVLTPSLHRGILPAIEYARSLSPDVRAVHIDTDPIDSALLQQRWDKWGGGVPLIILESPFRSLIQPLLRYLEEAKTERENHLVTVVIPEFVPAKWWHRVLHNQSGLLLKFVLLFRRDIVAANVRYYVKK